MLKTYALPSLGAWGMGVGPGNLISARKSFLPHLAGFVAIFVLAAWLRRIHLEPDPVLQGYLQVVTGLLAFVFAAIALVRFRGTQDRIALILGTDLNRCVLQVHLLSRFLRLRESRAGFSTAPRVSPPG